MLTGQLSTDEQIARFEREAKLAGRLQYLHIVDGSSLSHMGRDNLLAPGEASSDVQVSATTGRVDESCLRERLRPFLKSCARETSDPSIY